MRRCRSASSSDKSPFPVRPNLVEYVPTPLEDASPDDAVAAHQVGPKRRAVPRSRLRRDRSDGRVVPGRQPARHGANPVGQIWSTDVIDRRIRHLTGSYLKPLRIDLLVIVNETEQIARSRRDAGVARLRRSLPRFQHIVDWQQRSLCVLANNFGRGIGAVIVHNVHRDLQPFRHRSAQEAVQRPAQQGLPVIGRDDNVELHGSRRVANGNFRVRRCCSPI